MAVGAECICDYVDTYVTDKAQHNYAQWKGVVGVECVFVCGESVCVFVYVC